MCNYTRVQPESERHGGKGEGEVVHGEVVERAADNGELFGRDSEHAAEIACAVCGQFQIEDIEVDGGNGAQQGGNKHGQPFIMWCSLAALVSR